tara:strand:+ start:4233 stop:4613 length:381 start_codon:yes stop_codon:yes gene_type:complete
MVDLLICVCFFYILHLFLVMSFSLHKVPFLNWTYTGGDTSSMTDLSQRMSSASDNLRQSLPIFLVFSVLSIINNVDNLMLAKIWFLIRGIYLLGAIFNLYKIPLVRPAIWLPSVVVLVMMGLNIVA